MKAALTRGERLLRALGARLAAQPRRRLAVLCAALCVLALTGTLLAFGQRGAAPTQTPPQDIVSLPTATPTDTPTSTPTPTAKPKPKPTTPPTGKRVVTQPDALPAPPPMPTPKPKPTATPCPTPTPTLAPSPTASATSMATATSTATSTASPTATGATAPLTVAYVGMPAASCTPCGQYSGTNPSRATIQAALDAAAQRYGLPNRLLYAVAWQESRWHEDVESCDGGIGLMQVQYYTYPWLNSLSQGGCDVALAPTSYDPYNVQGNAYLGAKYLAWLKCLYAYNAPKGGNATNPVNGSSGYAYRQAGLAYPDLKTLSGQTLTDCAPAGAGTPTPAPGACSLCLSLYDHNINGPTDTVYQDLADPNGVNSRWSCPFDPTKGLSDYELLDLVLSAYNEGPNTLYEKGVLNANSYVGPVESEVTAFAQGTLPR